MEGDSGMVVGRTEGVPPPPYMAPEDVEDEAAAPDADDADDADEESAEAGDVAEAPEAADEAPAAPAAAADAGEEEEESGEEEGSTEYETDDSSEYETDSEEEEEEDDEEEEAAEEHREERSLAATTPADEVALKEEDEKRARLAAEEAEAKRIANEQEAQRLEKEAEAKGIAAEKAAAEKQRLKGEAAAAKLAAAEARKAQRAEELAKLQRQADEAAAARAIEVFGTIEPDVATDPMAGKPFMDRLPENLKTVVVDLPAIEEGFADAPVLDVVFVTDDLVLSSSMDGRVSLWSLVDNKVVAQFKPYGDEPAVFLHKLPVREKGVLPILTLSGESRVLKTWHLSYNEAKAVEDIPIPDNGKEVAMRIPVQDDETARLAQKSREVRVTGGDASMETDSLDVEPDHELSRGISEPNKDDLDQETPSRKGSVKEMANVFARGMSQDEYDAEPVADETLLSNEDIISSKLSELAKQTEPEVATTTSKSSRSQSVKFATSPSVVEFAEEDEDEDATPDGMGERASSSVKDIAARFGGSSLPPPIERDEHKEKMKIQMAAFGGASASSTPDIRTPRDEVPELEHMIPDVPQVGAGEEEMPRTKSVAERMALFGN
ncbi:hypothetical protein FVE85_7450 [Porphyridium purpureum]|uniref:Uncharacterized protein n=1 Tax=Porphyridium purpureum TaxID=35688 RepID=A0A5J4Z953_PORPP|nr:hypothetical protein FVE85_7450 [Porphyridium purpureum]|eukprot:POR7990..scf295_1